MRKQGWYKKAKKKFIKKNIYAYALEWHSSCFIKKTKTSTGIETNNKYGWFSSGIERQIRDKTSGVGFAKGFLLCQRYSREHDIKFYYEKRMI